MHWTVILKLLKMVTNIVKIGSKIKKKKRKEDWFSVMIAPFDFIATKTTKLRH